MFALYKQCLNLQKQDLYKIDLRGGFLLQKRCLHPMLYVVLKPFTKFAAMITGRGLRNWWRDLPKDKRRYFKLQMYQNRWQIAGSIGAAGIVGGSYYYTHVEEVPITKRKRFMAFTHKQFEAVVEHESKTLLDRYAGQFLPKSHPAVQYVGEVANHLYKSNKKIFEDHHIKQWSVAVIKDDIENAFVLPNGQVFVFTGMLDVVDNKDQLGIVLAHEMVHAILEHSVEMVSHAQLVDAFVVIVLAAIWLLLPSDGIAAITTWFFNKVVDIILTMPFGRRIEEEADKVGLELAARACYDVRQSSAFWTKMAVRQADGLNPPEWLSTHPSHESRSENLDKLMPNAIELRRLCRCPQLNPRDPRVPVSRLRDDIARARSPLLPVVPLAGGRALAP